MLQARINVCVRFSEVDALGELGHGKPARCAVSALCRVAFEGASVKSF